MKEKWWKRNLTIGQWLGASAIAFVIGCIGVAAKLAEEHARQVNEVITTE